ncbi:hypothetical protein [Acuticoccus mangrovi]|nr:hypothetical protein [Acuticoccus mangrovi]
MIRPSAVCIIAVAAIVPDLIAGRAGLPAILLAAVLPLERRP